MILSECGEIQSDGSFDISFNGKDSDGSFVISYHREDSDDLSRNHQAFFTDELKTEFEIAVEEDRKKHRHLKTYNLVGGSVSDDGEFIAPCDDRLVPMRKLNL